MGDAPRMRLLIGAPQEVLLGLSVGLGDLSLTKAAVLRVLYDLRARRIRQSAAGEWARFVMRGYVRGYIGEAQNPRHRI